MTQLSEVVVRWGGLRHGSGGGLVVASEGTCCLKNEESIAPRIGTIEGETKVGTFEQRCVLKDAPTVTAYG